MEWEGIFPILHWLPDRLKMDSQLPEVVSRLRVGREPKVFFMVPKEKEASNRGDGYLRHLLFYSPLGGASSS